MRSADMFLGVAFNIASYAMLSNMIAHVTGIGVKELILTIGDAHIYANHIEKVHLQLSRDSFPQAALILNPTVTSIDGFQPEDIQLVEYQSHAAIPAPMAV
jgi:thymidylate synthase